MVAPGAVAAVAALAEDAPTRPRAESDAVMAALMPAVPSLVRLLRVDAPAHKHAAAALAFLATSDERSDAIKDAGAVAPLLRLHDSPEPHGAARSASASALARLAPLTSRSAHASGGAKPI